MFQRFTSALFGGDVEELSRSSRPGDCEEEEDEEEGSEDWILVNYLAESCSGPCGESGSTAGTEEGEELVMIPSPRASPRIRYASCTSLNSTSDTEPDGGAEDEEEVEGGFLRLDMGSLEESWFVTPPACFTRRGIQPLLLETSPLENLLIEHPSMSVYTRPHSPPRRSLDPLPHSLDLGLGLLPGKTPSSSPKASGGKEKGRRALDGPRHRPDVAVVQRRSSLHTACFAAALSAHAGLLQQRSGNAAQSTQPLSRKALRRLNLLRPPKASTVHLHQPSQRHLNF